MKTSSNPCSKPWDAGSGLPGRAIAAGTTAIRALEFMTPVLDLGIRIFVGLVFFQSGLTKIASWSTTLALFESEYAVPLLPPELAAYLGTAAELCLPVLLVLGLGTRASALALFVFNAIAVISYPGLGEVGLKDHQYWGLLLLVTFFHGPGRLSLDYLIGRYVFRSMPRS
ncbi:DoxX family protein [Cupriavidus basilensis]|uniref:DoxX family protein n=1 Tax=Cupriavidus basilensis TaxID=68895 RepID=UPI0023E7FA97|nr:DoxX family protein [Cupriavidus basilensis]MDF3884211.1 DoxX family protein [Cupriavidus basilensis]